MFSTLKWGTPAKKQFRGRKKQTKSLKKNMLVLSTNCTVCTVLPDMLFLGLFIASSPKFILETLTGILRIIQT